MPAKTDDRLEWFVLAAALVAAAVTVPPFLAQVTLGSFGPLHRLWLRGHIDGANFESLFHLAFGLLLVAPHPIRGGLVVPRMRHVKWRILLACGSCVIATLLFNQRLNMPALRGTNTGYWMWLTGPPAEDLVFAGLLFGKFDGLFPGNIARRISVRRAVPIVACYFSLFHAVNFLSMDPAFVRQQMLYAFAGGFIGGLTRQWTGSILPGTLTHMTVNWIAWNSFGWNF